MNAYRCKIGKPAEHIGSHDAWPEPSTQDDPYCYLEVIKENMGLQEGFLE
ncbi:MAG: hypothetical protein HKP42_12805 [Maribacter sp.]|nr:hypothetical protein [Maribacter sp.]